MYNRNECNGFTYWKRPWHKWLVLAAGVMQLICLWMNIREYQEIAAAGIFSAAELANIASSKYLQCALNGLLAGIFFGTILIGMCVRSKRESRRAEGILFLVLSVVWGTAGAILHTFSLSGRGISWVLILLLMLGGTVYGLWGCWRKEC